MAAARIDSDASHHSQRDAAPVLGAGDRCCVSRDMAAHRASSGWEGVMLSVLSVGDCRLAVAGVNDAFSAP